MSGEYNTEELKKMKKSAIIKELLHVHEMKSRAEHDLKGEIELKNILRDENQKLIAQQKNQTAAEEKNAALRLQVSSEQAVNEKLTDLVKYAMDRKDYE